MPHRDINNLKDLDDIAVLSVFVAALWGSIMNWINHERRGVTLLKRAGFFLFDTTSTMSISITVYLILVGFGYNDILSVGISSFSAHYGTRSFYILQAIVLKKLDLKKEDIDAN